MDLRLRSNEVAARFLMKPSGLRSFCLCALSLLGHRSMRICSLVVPRTKPKISSARGPEFVNRLLETNRDCRTQFDHDGLVRGE